MAEEKAVEETPIPLYFDRFIEERDRRFIAELQRLEAHIQHNAQRIDELRHEVERRFAELREEPARRFGDVERRFAEARDERLAIREELERRFAEARDERKAMRGEVSRLDAKMDSHFRWIMGLMIPLVLGVVAMFIRAFLLGPTP